MHFLTKQQSKVLINDSENKHSGEGSRINDLLVKKLKFTICVILDPKIIF